MQSDSSSGLMNYSRILQLAIALDNWRKGGRISSKGQGHRIIIPEARLRNTKICIYGSNNTLQIGAGTRLFDSSIVIRGEGHHVTIEQDCIFNQLMLTVESLRNTVAIGNRVHSAPVRIDVVEPDVSLVIGADCMISRGVEIICADSHPVLDVVSGRRINPPRSVEIGDHVWLGAHVTVHKGTKIGRDSIVGIRSIVSGRIPSGVIVSGHPATVIRTGITWER